MRFKEKVGCVLTVILLTLCLPATGLAVPAFMIKPKLSAGWRTDSNYYKVEDNETEVHTYLVQPGIEFGYETAKSLLMLDYTVDAHFYDYQDETPADAETDDFVGHTLSLKTQTKPTARFTVGLEESSYQTRDPLHTDILSNYEIREEYYINRLTPWVVYEFGPRFNVGARYRWTEVDYDRSVEEDSTGHQGILDLKYNLTEHSSVGLQYQHWTMDYDRDRSDYVSDYIGLVFERRSKYFSFDAGGGYHKRSFDEAGLEDIDTFAYHVGVKGEKASSHIALRAERNFDNYHEQGDYHRAQRVGLELGHVFMGKLPATVEGVYQNSNYEGVTTSTGREDDTYGISGSLDYMFTDWLTFGVTAGYQERDSNLAGFDYDNTFFMIGLDLAYDVGEH